MKKVKIIGTSFIRHESEGSTKHIIELHLEGKIPHSGFGLKEIQKLIKKSRKYKFTKIKS